MMLEVVISSDQNAGGSKENGDEESYHNIEEAGGGRAQLDAPQEGGDKEVSTSSNSN